MNKRKRDCAAEQKRSPYPAAMMDSADSDPTFEKHLPGLRANYAFLETGRHILKEIVLWTLRKDDIPNVHKFVMTLGLEEKLYKRSFAQATRESFRCNGIDKIDITALAGLYYIICPQVREVGDIVRRIKNRRNDILHNIFLNTIAQGEEVLNKYQNEIQRIIEDTVKAFDGVTTDQQKSSMKDFVNSIFNEVRNTTGDQTVKEESSLQLYSNDKMISEDIYLNLIEKTLTIAGRNGNVTIYSIGESNVKFENCTIGTVNNIETQTFNYNESVSRKSFE